MRGWIRTTVSVGAASLALGTTYTATAQAAPTFGAATTVPATRAWGLGIGDFNGDGRPDLAVGTDASASLTVLLKEATGSGYTALSPAPAVGSNPTSVAVGDLNADGRPDIVTANRSSDAVSVLLKSPSGPGFNALPAIPAGRVPQAVTIGDLNADGRPDLAVANGLDDTVSVLLKDAGGAGFTALAAIPVGKSPQSVAIGDFNGDGRPDLAVANTGDNTVSVLLKDPGSTGFMARNPAIPVGSAPYALIAGALNGDGRDDIAVANASSSTLSVLYQDDAGTGFNAISPIPTGFSPVSVARGDLDGDGRPDLAVANSGSGTVGLLTADPVGSGYVAVNPALVVGNQPRTVAIADLNADGRPDLVSANAGDGTVSVRLNTSLRPTSASVACTPDPVKLGASTSCKATVSDIGTGTASRPTGTVTFTPAGSCTLADASAANQASCTTTVTPSAAGTVSISGAYGGDATHATSGGADSVTVTKRASSLSVSCSPNSTKVGVKTTCTAGVIDADGPDGPAPTGTVTFTPGGTCTLTAGASTGPAFCSVDVTPSAAGTLSVSASYGGDASHSASSASAPTTVTVTKRTTATAISCTPDSTVVGAKSTCAATVSDNDIGTRSTPTGTVAFTSGSFSATCTLAAGTAPTASCSVDYAPTATGTPAITGQYGSDATHLGSSGSDDVTVGKRATATTVACAPTSTAVATKTTCTATVNDSSAGTTSTPTGSVAFAAGTTTSSCTLTATTTAGRASCAVVPELTATGSLAVSGTYGSDATHNGSTGSTTVTVTKRAATAGVLCSPSTTQVGVRTTCTVSVHDDTTTGTATAPTGTVGFASSQAGTFSTPSCTLGDGTGSQPVTCAVDYTPTQAGTDPHQITATYAGDDAHAGAGGTTELAVVKPTPTPPDTGTTGTPPGGTTVPAGPAGPGGPGGLTKDTLAPQLAGLTLPTKAKRGKPVTLRFTSTEAATLRVVLTRKTTGVRKGTKCVAGRARGKQKKCTTTASVKTLTTPVPAGTGSLTLATKTLPTGPLTLTLTATDAAGNASTPIVRKLTLTKK